MSSISLIAISSSHMVPSEMSDGITLYILMLLRAHLRTFKSSISLIATSSSHLVPS